MNMKKRTVIWVLFALVSCFFLGTFKGFPAFATQVTDTPAGTVSPVGTETSTETPVETETPAGTASPAETVSPVETASPVETSSPAETVSPVETEMPSETASPVETEAPKKELVTLKTPQITCTERTASKITLQWKSVSGAKRYYIYRATTKSGTYKKLGSTTKLSYTDTSLKAKKTYYYKIYAKGTKDGQTLISKYSKVLKATTKGKVAKTAYVGDSVISGLASYKIVTGSGKRVIYKIGVSPSNFYNGSPMDSLLSYKPDRVYILLGVNFLGVNATSGVMDSQLKYYKKIIKDCLKEKPDMQVIVLPVSPTRPTASRSNAKINAFNKKLKKMASELGVYYYDYTKVLKGSDGALKKSYSAGDGIHLTPAAYKKLLAALNTYGKNLD